MAINLTNPMSGDAFKKEIENALDKRGDMMNEGATLALGKDPENDMDAVTKKYFDGLIYYLNNVSPVTLRRDYDGDLRLSDYLDMVDFNPSDCVPDGESSSTVVFEVGSGYTYTNIYTIDTTDITKYALGYKSPRRDIKVSLSYNFSNGLYRSYDGYSSGTYRNFTIKLDIKNQGGDVVYTSSFSGRNIKRGTYELEISVDTSKMEDGEYSFNIDILDENDPIASNSLYKSTDFTLSISSIKEQAYLRNIIEY